MMLRVAPWVMEEEKLALHFSLVGFLKFASITVSHIVSWLGRSWGKSAVGVKKMEADIVLLQFQSTEEAEEVLLCAKDNPSSPFLAIDRCMEVLEAPSHPQWVRMLGVPMHAWREGVFRLLGDCLGQTLEVDHATCSKEVIFPGRVRCCLGKSSSS